MDWQGDNEMRRHQRADVNKRGHVQPAGVASGISRALDVEARASRVLLTASQIFQCRAWKTAASAVLVAFAITVGMIVACLYTTRGAPPMSLPGALHTGLLTWVLIKADTVMRLFARMLALIDDGAGTVEVAQSLALFIVLVAGMCAVYAVLATSAREREQRDEGPYIHRTQCP